MAMTEKEWWLASEGYEDWEVHMGTLVCPHGHRCEDDQRNGLGDCGCVSPMVQEGLI